MARLFPSLDAWHTLGGRVHLSPCVSLHLSPVVSPPRCLARLSGWTRLFVSVGSLVSLCLPSFVSRCLPAWMIQSGWTGSFVSLCHLSPVVSQPGCLARLSGWTGSFVSLCLPSFVSQPGCLTRLGFICLPLSPFICLPLSPSLDAWVDRCSPFVSLHLSPVVSQPGSGTALWVDGFMCLPLSPSFVSRSLPAWMPLGGRVHLSPFVSLDFSRCLPAWMPGTALWVDGFICLPLSPFICLPLSPSLDAWRGSLGGRVHLSTFVSQDVWHPFVSLHLSPVVSQPGCLALFFWWTDSLFSFCLPSFGSCCLPAWMSVTAPISVGGRIHLFPFVSLYLSPVVSQPGCLARLSGWTDSFVSRCLPACQPGCVALTLRGFLHPRFCPFGGVWFAFGFGPGFGHSLSCGCWGQGPPLSAFHLDFDFAWARGGSSSLSIVGYTLSVRSVPRYQLRSRADDSGALRCAASATRRLC